MKVSELIKQLEKYDGNLDVAFYDRDFGSQEAIRVRSVRIERKIGLGGLVYMFYKYAAKKCANAVAIE